MDILNLGLNVFMNQFLDDILDLVLFGDDPVFDISRHSFHT